MTLPADLDATIVQATSQGNFPLLDDLARTADALRKYDVEARLLQEALIIRGNVSGQMSLDYGIGFRKLGDYWREQNDLATPAASTKKLCRCSETARRPPRRSFTRPFSKSETRTISKLPMT